MPFLAAAKSGVMTKAGALGGDSQGIYNLSSGWPFRASARDCSKALSVLHTFYQGWGNNVVEQFRYELLDQQMRMSLKTARISGEAGGLQWASRLTVEV